MKNLGKIANDHDIVTKKYVDDEVRVVSNRLDNLNVSPTAVSIVKTINEGTALIKLDKIEDLVNKLSSAQIVSTINSGANTINVDKITGLNARLVDIDNKTKGDKVIDSINADTTKTINTNKITGLDTTLAGKASLTDAQNKADTALQNAKSFTTQEINKLINGAGPAYDTLKELGDLVASNKGLAESLATQIGLKTGKFSQVIGNGATKEFTITHNLNSTDVIAMVRENSAPFAEVLVDKEYFDVNKVKLIFGDAPKINEFKVIVIG
jgi:hypothetical protein